MGSMWFVEVTLKPLKKGGRHRLVRFVVMDGVGVIQGEPRLREDRETQVYRYKENTIEVSDRPRFEVSYRKVVRVESIKLKRVGNVIRFSDDSLCYFLREPSDEHVKSMKVAKALFQFA